MSRRARLPIIELSLLVFLAAPAVTLAPPYVSRALNAYQAQRATDTVEAALLEARHLAVDRNRVVRVEIDTRSGVINVESGRWRRLPDRVVIAGPPADDDGVSAIVFLPDGSSSGGQLVVSADGRAWWLVVESRDGSVRRQAGIKPRPARALAGSGW